MRIITVPTDRRTAGKRDFGSVCAVLTLTVALVFAVKALTVEYQVWAMRDASVQQAADLGDVQAVVESRDMPQDLAPRSALLRATIRARAAGSEPTLAARLLPLASADLDRALNARPSWAEAQISATYIHYLADGPTAPATLMALERSYAAAPFLRDSGPWRIRYAVSIWPLLRPETRQRVIRETAWLARATGHTYNYARGLVAGSPAAAEVDALLAVNND